MSMIQDHYEVNVSFHGIHLFATDDRSIATESKMEQIVGLFKNKFPEREGYKISVTKVECRGKPIK